MQILLLFCLIKNFLFEDYSMERYGSAEVILNDNGYIFLKTKGFSTGDSIYITLKSFEKEYPNYIEYTYWYYESSYGIKIDQIKYAYSEFDYNYINVINLRNYFLEKLRKITPNIKINGSLEDRLPGNINVSFLGHDAIEILMQLDVIVLMSEIKE